MCHKSRYLSRIRRWIKSTPSPPHFDQPLQRKETIMKVTIIGAGNMGAALSKQLALAGHQVRVIARDLNKASELNRSGVTVVPAQGAAEDADAVIVATSYGDAAAALAAVGSLASKVVIDITNPLSADYISLTVGHTTSAAEEIAKAFPDAQIVKAFNTLFAQVIAAGADFGNGRRASTFVASDSERAKQTASTLAQSMGFEVVDAGGLKNARYLEPLAGLNIYLGYGAGLGTSIAPNWLHKA
ncbi:NADPH-dependent F420 reductase [Ralstonia solanacearum]|uniref:NADPH-dependent F420 reductase n=1 Tax=Ralstonia solanacearum TaxID=305 RepID=UPI002E1B1267